MLVDLKSQALTHKVVMLIAHCLADTHPETLRTVADYYDHKEALFLKGFLEEDDLVGIVGYAYKAPRKILMTHLAVDPEFRGRGVATRMLRELVEAESIKWIGAESTASAVPFYQKLNFDCILKTSRDDGENHFSCEWKRDESKSF
jgi:ribosomal protein S18 acetylase RimI-like enzyme